MKAIAVFCGSSTGNDPAYMEQARSLGMYLAEENIKLIYGGSKVGLMGAVANGVLDAGGKVIGVLPEKLARVEIAHEGLSELFIVNSMHERKAKMAEFADAFIALPGGTGTLEEWFEVFTWSQIGYHTKPCGLLNTNDYYTPLVELFDHMIQQGFVRSHFKQLIAIDKEPKKLLEKLRIHDPNYIQRW